LPPQAGFQKKSEIGGLLLFSGMADHGLNRDVAHAIILTLTFNLELIPIGLLTSRRQPPGPMFLTVAAFDWKK